MRTAPHQHQKHSEETNGDSPWMDRLRVRNEALNISVSNTERDHFQARDSSEQRLRPPRSMACAGKRSLDAKSSVKIDGRRTTQGRSFCSAGMRASVWSADQDQQSCGALRCDAIKGWAAPDSKEQRSGTAYRMMAGGGQQRDCTRSTGFAGGTVLHSGHLARRRPTSLRFDR